MTQTDHTANRHLHARILTLTATVRAQAETIVSQETTIATQAATIARLTAERETFVSPTVREVHAAYKAERERTPTWLNSTRYRLDPLVRLLGDLPAVQLTPKKWAAHVKARRLEPNQIGGGYPSDGTLTLELGCAKAMLSWASDEEQGLIRFNPLTRAKRRKAKPRKTWLNEAQVVHLATYTWTDDRWRLAVIRAFVLCGADAGPRRNEVRTFRRDRAQESDDGVTITIDHTKNGKSHTVGLTPRAWAALQLLPEVPGNPHYFVNPKTRRLIGRATLWRWFKKAIKESGLDTAAVAGERVTPHALRRSAATNAHNRGASLLEVQDMLNHSSPAITAQYVQRTRANAVRIAKLMETGAAEEMRARRGPQRAVVHNGPEVAALIHESR